MSFCNISLDTADFAAAQDDSTKELVEFALPDAVRSAIRNAPIHDIYPISKNEVLIDQIIRAREITFSSSATLILSNHKLPFYVLFADTFSFLAPFNTVSVRFPSVIASRGKDGVPGRPGVPGGRNCGRTGCRGGNGEDATHGTNGETIQWPRFYVFANELRGQPINPDPGVRFFKISGNGLDGGSGGNGGKGGKGGQGGKGADGSDTAISCKAGPGDGGTGGDGGRGGNPGNGADGGNGVTITFGGPHNVLDLIASFSEIENQGGSGGAGGAAGQGGLSGSGGDPGDLSTYCRVGGNRGHAGRGGASGVPQKGHNGFNGNKGDVIRMEVTSIHDLIA